MYNKILTYSGMALLLVLFQVLLLDHIKLGGYINPYLYVLLILLLPFETPKSLLLIIGFTFGLIIDIFSNTLGMHASATTFMAFLRPGVINIISARDNIETQAQPRLANMGFDWFLKYIFFLVFAHHFFLFFIEVFTFKGFEYTLLRGTISSLFTIVLILISQLLIYKE